MKKILIVSLFVILNSSFAQEQIPRLNPNKVNLELKLLENKIKFKLYHLSAKAQRMAPILLRNYGIQVLEQIKSTIPKRYWLEYNELLYKYNSLYDSFEKNEKKDFLAKKKDLENYVNGLKNKDLKTLLSPYIKRIEWTNKYIKGDLETNPLTDLSFVLFYIIDNTMKQSTIWQTEEIIIEKEDTKTNNSEVKDAEASFWDKFYKKIISIKENLVK